MSMSDSAIRERIRICQKQLDDLEKNKERLNYQDLNYQDEKDDILYELECWKRQLEFGTASIW